MNKKLTITHIKRLTVPATGYHETTVGSVPGLRVRVIASGVMSFVFRYKSAGKNNCITLNRVDGADSLKTAENRASELRWMVDRGQDPAQDRREEKAKQEAISLQVSREDELNPLFSVFAFDYLERYAKRRKKTWQRDEYHINRHLIPAIGNLRIQSVTRRDIVRVLNAQVDKNNPVQANHIRALLSKMFNWAISQALIENNPVTRTERQQEKSRDRVLSEPEIRTLWASTGKRLSGLALRFILLSGQRPGEVVTLRWEDIRDDVWRMEDTKNGRSHTVPVSLGMWKVLDDVKALQGDKFTSKGHVFASRKTACGLTRKAVAAYMQGLGFEIRATPHDLRRTAITTVSMLGHGREVQNAIANHIDHSVGGIYDRWGYMPEKLKALDDLWGEVQRVVGLNVVEFPKLKAVTA